MVSEEEIKRKREELLELCKEFWNSPQGKKVLRKNRERCSTT
jgi:hypothetical protein